MSDDDTALGPQEPMEAPEGTDGDARTDTRRPGGLARFTSLYGASPVHLLLLVLSIVIALYAAQQVYSAEPEFRNWRRYAIWFLGAAVFHDLVLAPFYIAVDRATQSLRARAPKASPGTVNYLRFPAVISGVLFLVFGAAILQRGEGAFGRASGLDQDPYLGRWLIVTAVLFAASGLLYVVNRLRSARSA